MRIAAAVLALTLSPLAHAEDAAMRRPPVAAVRAIGVGTPDLYGASGSIYVPRPLALEVGISGQAQGDSWYARAGVALPLREPGARGQGYPTFDVLVEPMVGFRWLEPDVDSALAGPTFSVSVEPLVWVNSRAALEWQLSLGADYWTYRTDPTAVPFAPDLHVGMGFAF